MSSNIRIQRICQYCSNEFTAKTTKTTYCSLKCASKSYKAKTRGAKIEVSNKETNSNRLKPIEQIKAKEYLTVRDVSILLNCSIRTAYRLIEQGNINAVNISVRKTLVKRSDIDRLFQPIEPIHKEIKPEPIELNISECYFIGEIQSKFGISDSALFNIIKRNNIPKITKGKFTYVPKNEIDKLLS